MEKNEKCECEKKNGFGKNLEDLENENFFSLENKSVFVGQNKDCEKNKSFNRSEKLPKEFLNERIGELLKKDRKILKNFVKKKKIREKKMRKIEKGNSKKNSKIEISLKQNMKIEIGSKKNFKLENSKKKFKVDIGNKKNNKISKNLNKFLNNMKFNSTKEREKKNFKKIFPILNRKRISLKNKKEKNFSCDRNYTQKKFPHTSYSKISQEFFFNFI